MTHPMVEEIRQALAAAADPEKAGPMQAYMKTEQPFYGVPSGPRRKLFKQIAKRHKLPDRGSYEQVVLELWQGEHREEMYQALEAAEYFRAFRTPEAWPLFERLVRTATHWDTLDWIAAKLISPLVLEHREFEQQLRAWAGDENLWVRRASLLAHLHHDEATNTDLLAETILRLAGETEFFIRKAIGWVLRDLSYSRPGWVRQFVESHADELSGLSRREALKQLERSGA